MSSSDYSRLSVEDKMAKVMVNLRRLRPYYSAVYEVLERIESKDVQTMGVNLKQLIYNPDFVDKLSFEELMFVTLHEVSHVALMHMIREKGREHKLWNIACDLYINAMLEDEFRDDDIVKMPKDVLYCSSIDLDNETAEGIYDQLKSQMDAQEEKLKMQLKKESDNENNPDSSNSDASTKDKKAKTGIFGKKKQTILDSTDTEDELNNSNNKDDSGCDLGENSDSNDSCTGGDTGSSDGDPTGSNAGSSDGDPTDNNMLGGLPIIGKYKVSYKGTKPIGKKTDVFELPVSALAGYRCDIDPNGDGGSGSDALDEQTARGVLSDADVKARMMGGSVGRGTCRIEQYITETLKSKMDWRSLLRKYCIALKSTETSFARPDKRMYYQNAIYPGNEVEESNHLKDIKIAIDTSGSVSDEYLKYIYGQIKDILNQYKVSGELILWDGVINEKGDFNSFNEIKNTAIKGRGGTRPDCIFEYYDSKACKIKPALTLVFSDGYYWGFENNPMMGKWKRKYKDTIWVMTKEYNHDFKPPFGKLAYAKF